MIDLVDYFIKNLTENDTVYYSMAHKESFVNHIRTIDFSVTDANDLI